MADPALLDYMGKFMSEQTLFPRRVRSAEDNVLTHRVGVRVHRAGRFRSPLVGMHTHLAEVISKARL